MKTRRHGAIVLGLEVGQRPGRKLRGAAIGLLVGLGAVLEATM